MASISDQPQPEITPASPPAGPPSLWLYLVLLFLAVGLICTAFAMQTKPDWPGLLLNLAAGLVGSIVILVFVDRRLRAQELYALRRLPTRTTQRFSSLLFPTSRIGQRYARSLLIALENLVAGKLERDQFHALEERVRIGFVLVGLAGEGKTTWTQMVAASLVRKYLDGLPSGRIPIIFPLPRWLPDRKLDQALYEVFSSYAVGRRWVFDRLLRTGRVIVLLDGYDELWTRHLPLAEEVNRLRKLFPDVAWTITSRTDKPTPAGFGEAVVLAPPTSEELAAIARVKASR